MTAEKGYLRKKVIEKGKLYGEVERRLERQSNDHLLHWVDIKRKLKLHHNLRWK